MRSDFFRDFNARLSEAVRFFVPEFGSGPLFARRYAEQALVEHLDLEDYFFYCALQPMLSGLCEKLKEYPGYNSFNDAICGQPKIVEDFDRAAYNAAKRYNPNVKKKDFITYRKLHFTRLPGYEDLSQHEYHTLMPKKFDERRIKVVNKRKAERKGFLGPERLREVKAGSIPRATKTSMRESKRPLVLTKNPEPRLIFLEWYFGILFAYKLASKKFRDGDLTVAFPPGTYRPPSFVSF